MSRYKEVSMNRATLNQCLIKPTVKSYPLSQWPEILMAQHIQLESEINTISTLVAQDECHLLQLDARLKKLIKGVLTHLELEACFLAPALGSYNLSYQQSDCLNQGFQALEQTCNATASYLHSLKLALGNGSVEPEHAVCINQLLHDIHARLESEDIVYSTLKRAG